MNDATSDPQRSAPEDEAPLHEMEALAQRYLDGTLGPAEEEEAERLLAEDGVFAEHVGTYAALFTALDRHAFEAPPDLATSAIARWSAQLGPPQAGWLQVFGGLRRGLGVFAALDLVLASLLLSLMITRGPLALLKSWVLGVKDLVVLASHLIPSAEVAAAVVPSVLLLCTAALGASIYGVRSLLLRTEVSR